MKIKERIVSIVFVMFLVAPSLIFALVGNKFDKTNYENRNLAEKPNFSIGNWSEYPKSADDYINDHAAFKNQFVKLNSIINLKLFNTVISEKVLAGKDGWLFYKNKEDGDPIGCYQGTNRFTPEQLEIIKNNLVQIKNKFDKENKEFVLLLAPNKEQIYADYMPSYIKVINEYRGIDEVVDYIRNNTDITVIYPKEELLEAKKQYQIYNKYDTHWNSVGSFIGAQQLMERLKGKRKYIDDVEVTPNGVSKNDLAIMINLKNYLKESTGAAISGYNENVEVKQTHGDDTVGRRIHKFESNADDERKIMIVRDSFSLAMFEHIPKEFKNAVFIHTDDFKNQYLKDENPDIVVYQLVERCSYKLLERVMELSK